MLHDAEQKRVQLLQKELKKVITKRSDRNITNKKEEYGKKRIEERWQPGKDWP